MNPSKFKQAIAGFLLGSFLAGGNFAKAEDDLMSILEGKTPQAAQFVENQDLISLKKASGNQTPEQNIFFQFLGEKKYEKALFQWASAFSGTEFQNSSTGRALEALLKFKNGLEINGLEALFQIADPAQIDSSVISLWKETVKGKTDIWQVTQVTWSPFWTQIFGTSAEIAVLLQKNFVTADVATLTEMIKKTNPESLERSVLEWQLTLNLGLAGDSAKAAQVLAHLMKTKANPINKELMTLTAGRLLYQNGFLDPAIQYYKKIPKSSDHWFVAQEEMAWAYMRKGEPQNAIAITQTLTYSKFKGWVGMEAFLLDAFSRLKVCDYPGVMATLQSIKPQFGDHLQALEKLVKDPQQPVVEKLFTALAQGSVSAEKLGQLSHELPMAAGRDEMLILLVKVQKALFLEADRAAQLFGRSLTFGNLQGQFDTLKNQVLTRANLAKGSSQQRLQELASIELADSKQLMQKLRIVEVEMIQQVDAASKLLALAGPSEIKSGVPSTNNKYAMNFSGDKDVWFDELSNFKVDIKKGCGKSGLSAKE